MAPHLGIDTTWFERYCTQSYKEGRVRVAVHTATLATDIITTKCVSNVRITATAQVTVGHDRGALG